MKSKRLWVMFITLILALMLTPAKMASACSCVPEPSPELALKRADAIFVGEVIGVDSGWFGVFSGHWMRKTVLFQVQSTWKGVSASQVIATVWERYCSWTPLGYYVGETYLVYAEASTEWRWETSYWDGTQSLDDAAEYLGTLGQSTPPSQQVDLKNGFYLPQYGCIAMGVLVLLAAYFVTRPRRPRSEQ